MSTVARRSEFMATLNAVDAAHVLSHWTRRTGAAEACFGISGCERLARGRPEAVGARTVVYLSYENPMGASGGILAVIRRLPAELRSFVQRQTGPDSALDLLRLSPHHTNLATQYSIDRLRVLGQCTVPFDNRLVPVTIQQVTVDNEDWLLFGAPGFFEADGGVGRSDPYTYASESRLQRDGDESLLLRDSLFASKAVPQVLRAIGKTRHLIVHAHDWEFASAALTVKEAVLDETLESAAVVLTLHNPYDHQLSDASVAAISGRSARLHWPAIEGMTRTTVLTRMIPLLDAPVSVVSHQFALELTEAPIQTGVFTGHQQAVLRYQGLVGVDNGDFVTRRDPAFSEAARAGAPRDPTTIVEEKREKRATMLRALDEYLGTVNRDSPETRVLGDLTADAGQSLLKLPDHIPVFMMVGRLDPGQKGYDVCAHVIRSLPPGVARFVLTPMSPLGQDPDVSPFFDQLERLTKERLGEVVVFAHRMRRAYTETMAGATYGLWPSRYEPFGGAHEFYAFGTPVVAHAVGGLVQQVVGYEAAPSDATGFLYRTDPAGTAIGDLERQYREAHNARPGARVLVPVYRSECDMLRKTVLTAIDVFHDPRQYGVMLANLQVMRDALRWDQSVQDYRQWYDRACRSD